MSTLKLKAHNVRTVILYPNPAAKRSALTSVLGRVFSDDYFKVMEDNDLFTRESFQQIIQTGQPIHLVMTMQQVEALNDCNTFSRDNNLEEVFSMVIPRYVNTGRVNYCSRCGTFHETEAVFHVAPLEYINENSGDHEVWFGDDTEYGVFCASCHKTTDNLGVRNVVDRWFARRFELPDDIEDFVEEEVDKGHLHWDEVNAKEMVEAFINMGQVVAKKEEATSAFVHKQLELLGLNFLTLMTKEEFNALPK